MAWNGTLWVAVGKGTNTIAYSSDGIIWTPVVGSTSIFTDSGRSVSWSGTRWVAVGKGTNTIAYSSDGIIWTPVVGSISIFSNFGSSVAWNGTRLVAVGAGTNSIAYSSDGITWTGLGRSIFSTSYGVAGNPNVGATIVDSAITLNSNRLDIVSGNYYNTGYSNFSVDIISNSS